MYFVSGTIKGLCNNIDIQSIKKKELFSILAVSYMDGVKSIAIMSVFRI